jgi:succinate dehydrogenase / fumarate reductase cytochrome b subunit
MTVVKWTVRGGLLALLLIHVVSALRLAAMNAAARPVKYAVYRTTRTRFYKRWMVWTGVAILAFLIFHILHFTVGIVQPEYFHLKDPANMYDAYVMFVRGFQNTGVLIAYLVGMTALLPHLVHGISSIFQSLGWKHPKYDRALDLSGPVLGVVLYLGYIIPPLAVAFGVIKLPGA